MAQYFKIHHENPQARLVAQSISILREGGVIVYPTDSSYALGCCIGKKVALDRIRQLRQLPAEQNMTLLCRDLSEIASYATVKNSAFRMMKSMTPGPYTFILKAKRDVPKRLQHPKRKTIGIRIPDNPISLALLSALGEPMISISLVLPNEVLPETDPEVIDAKIGKQVDLIIDGEAGGMDFTTILDMTSDEPVVIREGLGAENLALHLVLN
jgi:tRNA threonylcarbamoyl adenosine modification protein (Sua5/YciO/YrdC/YwlC family)